MKAKFKEDKDKTWCYGCGIYLSWFQSDKIELCTRCAKLIPDYIPEKQYNRYIDLKRDKIWWTLRENEEAFYNMR